jgi:hypothetical protein
LRAVSKINALSNEPLLNCNPVAVMTIGALDQKVKQQLTILSAMAGIARAGGYCKWFAEEWRGRAWA